MIDSQETNIYEEGYYSGYDQGFNDCKEDLMEVIESLAHDVASYMYPGYYEFSSNLIESIMTDAGLSESYLKRCDESSVS